MAGPTPPAGRRRRGVALPIRARLTLVFVAAMALLLVTAGLFVRVTLARQMDEEIDSGLRARADDVASLVQASFSELGSGQPDPLIERGERFAQILGSDGRVIDATPLVRDRALLTLDQVRRATRLPLQTERAVAVHGTREPLRLRAVPVSVGRRHLVVAVGASLTERRDAVDNLTLLLAVGGPVTLLLASLAGFWVARAALRPVDRMRQRAAEISGSDPGARLPVPVARDELRRLGETLNDMLVRIDAALAKERRFVADASHELRTPLAILKAELELALRGDRSAAELRAAVASAGEETDRLARLAEDLLVVAHADQGRLPVRPEIQDARALLETVAGRFRARAGELGRGVAVEVHPSGLQVSVDPLRMQQALGNLVDNALRHGGGQVTLSATGVAQGVELAVSDRGPGIPPDFAGEAFERFARGDAGRGAGGAGLGLSIVRAIAEAHGGVAVIAPDGDVGARLVIRLPAGA